MPRGDGTGPNGEGPMTGRGLGPCGRGLAFRRGRGFGRGFRRFACAYPEFIQEVQLSKEQEKKILEEELKAIKEEMQEIEKRLKELKK